MQDNFEHNNIQGTQTPKLCYTAGGILIHNKKALLIKHKKLNIWLNPGGHIDEGELPHQAAEREFFEETGVKVQAVDAFSSPALYKKNSNIDFTITDPENNSKFFPNPISTNVHWVNKESYNLRLKSKNLNKRVATKTWKRGCEQHVGFFYLLQATNGLDFKQNTQETNGIAWFSLAEVETLHTVSSVREEIKLAFKLLNIK